MGRISTMFTRGAMMVMLVVLGSSAALAQANVFTVAVVPNTSHPDPNAHTEVYAVNGEEGKELTLIRGNSYEFRLQSVPTFHPFFISTSADGGDGGSSAYTSGVDGNGSVGDATVTFTVPQDAPDVLYYQCEFHQRMGGRLAIIDPVSGVDALTVGTESLGLPRPNPAGETFAVTLTLTGPDVVRVTLHDARGNQVRVVHDGSLAAGRHNFSVRTADLPSGGYQLRAIGSTTDLSRPVVVTK